MKKTPVSLLIAFVIFITLLFSVCLVNLVIMSSTLNNIEKKNINSLSSVFSELGVENISLEDLQRRSNTKNAQLPFSGFIKNLGQLSDSSIRYYYSWNGLSVGFSLSKVSFISSSYNGVPPVHFTFNFPDSHPVTPVGHSKTSHLINYFYGDWQLTNIPTYEEIWYFDLYPGIDLRYYMSSAGLKYEFVVHSGADPSQITVQVSESLTLSVSDQTVSMLSCKQAENRQFQDTKLQVFQNDGEPIPARFISKNNYLNAYSFQIEAFDPTQTLIIDPLLLSFSTYLGGTGGDYGQAIVVDAMRNSYIAGFTDSNGSFPLKKAFDSTNNGHLDVFVTKLNATGNGLLFSTFVGGSGQDRGYAIALDAAGNSYVTGHTYSADFPTQNAYQSTFNGTVDAFVFKLNATGNGLDFSTYLGGSNYDEGQGIRVDTNGNSYIAGRTLSNNFPTTPNAYNTTWGGNNFYDAFVTKLNATGDGLIFSTYLGGKFNDYGEDIAIDENGDCYIIGYTESSNFPLMNPLQPLWQGGWDVFVTKLNATGNGLNYSTYLGGNGNEWGYGIAVDSLKCAYVTGYTQSSNFLMIAPGYNTTYSGNGDAFVVKLDFTGAAELFSTFLGGTIDEYAYEITLDAAGNSYIIGQTKSPDFPMQNAYNSTFEGNTYDTFVTELNVTGTGLVFSTYLGGKGDEYGRGIALDAYENIYVTGYTLSSNFPMQNAYNSTYGGLDAYVSKFTMNDMHPPSIILNNPANNTIAQSGALIDLNVIEINSSVSHVFYSWDSATNMSLGPSYDLLLPTGDGQHVLRVYANDSADNWAAAIFVFTTDDTPPTITLTSPTNDTTHSSGTTIDLTITDLHSISQVRYNWDGGTNTTLAAPYQTTLPTGNGQHVLRIYAQDQAGNWASQTYVFTTEDPTSTSSSTTPTPTDFFTVEIVLLAFGFLVAILWRRKRHIKK
ncbi:MAG: SBBP repeat-containing protein [Candidatus Hermodarchaeota archaeon]